jgi:hypothetical protein
MCNVSDLLCWLIPSDMRLFIFTKFSESISKFGKPVIQFPVLSVMDESLSFGKMKAQRYLKAQQIQQSDPMCVQTGILLITM